MPNQWWRSAAIYQVFPSAKLRGYTVEAGRLLLPPTPESVRDWILLVEPLAEA